MMQWCNHLLKFTLKGMKHWKVATDICLLKRSVLFVDLPPTCILYIFTTVGTNEPVLQYDLYLSV